MAKLVVNFKDVATGGGRPRVPEGDYRVKISGVKAEESKEGNPMLVWKFTITEGKHKTKTFTDYTVLTENALWKVRSLLECIGIKVPDSRVDLTPVLKRTIGKELGITLVDEEYNKRISSKVSDYIDLETLEDFEASDDEEEEEEEEVEVDEDDDEEEEEEPPKRKARKKKKPVEDDDDEIEDLDLEGL